MFEKWRGRAQRPLPEDPEELTALSASLTDPWERRRCVDKALSIAPEDLSVLRTALMLGDLGTGSRGSVDFTRIKSFILTPFEKPEAFDEGERRRLAREIFDHPLLKKCLSLSGDPPAFEADYLRDLAREYCALFILSSGAHSGAFLGFSTRDSRLRAISAPMSAMLRNVSACPFLREGERAALLRALTGAFREGTEGKMDLVLEGLEGGLRGEVRALLKDARAGA